MKAEPKMKLKTTRHLSRILVAAVFCSLATPALAEKRVALVIGNS